MGENKYNQLGRQLNDVKDDAGRDQKMGCLVDGILGSKGVWLVVLTLIAAGLILSH